MAGGFREPPGAGAKRYRYAGHSLRRVAGPCKRDLLGWIASANREVLAIAPPARTGILGIRNYRELLKGAGLLGLGFGAKITDGKVTGAIAIRAYVARKRPKSDLSPGQNIPPVLAGVPTDVVVVGRPKLQAARTYPGAGISHATGSQGSVGAFARKPGGKRLLILSACHVLAPQGAAKGDLIVQPAKGIAGSSRVAALEEFVPLDTSEGGVNHFDAALATLDNNVDADAAVPNVGRMNLPTIEAALYQSVRKQGSTTLETFGLVMDAAADLTIGGNFFSGVIQVRGVGGAFSDGGDSGALVLDAMSARPLGLIIGGNQHGTYLSPISRIVDHFAIELVS